MHVDPSFQKKTQELHALGFSQPKNLITNQKNGIPSIQHYSLVRIGAVLIACIFRCSYLKKLVSVCLKIGYQCGGGPGGPCPGPGPGPRLSA